MKLVIEWTDSSGFNHEEFNCSGDSDFEACDYNLWKLVQDGYKVLFYQVDDKV